MRRGWWVLALAAAACSPGGGVSMQVSGSLPNPVFQVRGGAIGPAPCLKGFRVAPLHASGPYATANWSIKRASGCEKAAQIIYGDRPDGWLDRFPGEEGVKFYPSIRWPGPLVDGQSYVVTVELEGGRRAAFNVEFAASGARVTRARGG